MRYLLRLFGFAALFSFVSWPAYQYTLGVSGHTWFVLLVALVGACALAYGWKD